MSERLGLTDSEVDWLRANCASDEAARRLVTQYQMCVVCPGDHGARGIFEAMLDDWRRDRRSDEPSALPCHAGEVGRG